MIHDAIRNVANYAGLSPAFAKATTWLGATNLSALAEGRVDIDGERVFAVVASYDTWTASDFMLESHRRYHDIQVVVAGIESCRVLPPGVTPPVVTAYDTQRDATFFDPDLVGLDPADRGVDLVLRPGWFAVFMPDDVHGPNRAFEDRPASVRKVVVKVAAD